MHRSAQKTFPYADEYWIPTWTFWQFKTPKRLVLNSTLGTGDLWDLVFFSLPLVTDPGVANANGREMDWTALNVNTGIRINVTWRADVGARCDEGKVDIVAIVPGATNLGVLQGINCGPTFTGNWDTLRGFSNFISEVNLPEWNGNVPHFEMQPARWTD